MTVDGTNKANPAVKKDPTRHFRNSLSVVGGSQIAWLGYLSALTATACLAQSPASFEAPDSTPHA
jgi:hypothetical protein